MESKNEIHSIFKKYLSGNISKEELGLLLDHFDAQEIDNAIISKIQTEMQREVEASEDDHALASEVKRQLDEQLLPKRNVRSMWWYPAIAAAIAIASMYYFQLNQKPIDSQMKVAHEMIVPGSNKAILVLSDGRKIELSENTNETIEDDGGNAALHIQGGQIQYQVTANNSISNEKAYNTISVPLGGQFKVVLPDGSIARLNAGSSLRYPVSFGSSSRRMDLIGEGYFEVVKNKTLPFTVNSGNLEVTALGTEFNVNTYSNEPKGAATLVEGSLRVTNIKSQKTVIIKPGQQAYGAAGELQVRQVSSEVFTSWKDGLFVINRAQLDEVMRQVERWYDVRVEGVIPKTTCTVSGEFPREIPLPELLKSLERTTGVKFKIEERRITIK